MRRLVPLTCVYTLPLLSGCFEKSDDTGSQDTGVQSSVEITVDEVDSMAAVAFSGDRDQLLVTVIPEEAAIAGLPLDEVTLDLRLADIDDIGEDTHLLHGLLEGDIFDGGFTIDGVAYELDPAPVSGGVLLGPAPFHRADDSLALPVGEAEGDFNFYQLDDQGFDFSCALRFTFTAEGEPDRDIEHSVRVDTMVGSFAEI